MHGLFQLDPISVDPISVIVHGRATIVHFSKHASWHVPYVSYFTYECHSVKYIALKDGQWFDSWDKHKTELIIQWICHVRMKFQHSGSSIPGNSRTWNCFQFNVSSLELRSRGETLIKIYFLRAWISANNANTKTSVVALDFEASGNTPRIINSVSLCPLPLGCYSDGLRKGCWIMSSLVVINVCVDVMLLFWWVFSKILWPVLLVVLIFKHSGTRSSSILYSRALLFPIYL